MRRVDDTGQPGRTHDRRAVRPTTRAPGPAPWAHIRPLASLALAVGLATGVAACEEPASIASAALSSPIDFSYACQGDGHTVAPANDETPASLDQGRMCPNLPTGARGAMFGVVLSQDPGALNVLQMNPRFGTRGIIDVDRFIPGVTPIKVGDIPLRVLRASDWSSFYVVAAGTQDVTRLVIASYGTQGLDWTTTRFFLPGTPTDAVIVDDHLVIAAAHAAELWIYDLAADPADPPGSALPLEAGVQRLVPWGDRFIVTWQGRPVLSVLDADGQPVAEVGLGAACGDTLDNDHDGLTDAADPDCLDQDDDAEAGGATARPDLDTPPAASYAQPGAPTSCGDGLDNDGDGLTDYPFDPACAAPASEEFAPECADGLDNDGDGLTDEADSACYGRADRDEGQPSLSGPYEPALVDAGAAGTFVYVLDTQVGEIEVFELETDAGGATAFTKVAVNAIETTAPALTYRPYGADPTEEPSELEALRMAAKPSLDRRGEDAILLPFAAALSLTATRLRGEVWSRLIAPGTGLDGRASVPYGLDGDRWRPAGCDPDDLDQCTQPAGDDESWYVFAPRADGYVQMIEAVRRGVPVHRLAQRQPDPAKRTTDASKPRLSLRGRSIAIGSSLRAGYPFIGPLVKELLPTEPAATTGGPCATDDACTNGTCVDGLCVEDERAARYRRYGLWPATDTEGVVSERWALTYEGTLPETRSYLGRMVAADTLFDPAGEFCERGVEIGDWAVIEAAPLALAEELRHEAPVVTADGRVCDVEPPSRYYVEVPVVAVGQTTLTVDPAAARLRPSEPVLDVEVIGADPDQSLSACKKALELLQVELTRPENLPGTTLDPASLPRRFAYEIRARDSWVLIGSRSGYQHRWTWDAVAGECVEDLSLDPRHAARVIQSELLPDASYEVCPPTIEQLSHDLVDGLVDAAVRFENWSFALDVLPGCVEDDDGQIELVPTQRDTRWTFDVLGPDEGATVRLSSSILALRIGSFDFRRQNVYLDTGGERASLFQVRPGVTELLATYQ